MSLPKNNLKAFDRIFKTTLPADSRTKDYETKKLVQGMVKEIYRQSVDSWEKWFNSLSTMLVVLDENEVIITCNNAFRKYIKKPKNKIRGSSFSHILLQKETKNLKSNLGITRLCLKEHSQKIFTGDRWLKISADPLIKSRKKIKYIIVTLSDITESINNIFRIESEKNKFQDLVSMANVAIASDDIEGKMTYFNTQFATMFGYTEEEIENKRHVDLVHPDDLEMLNKIHTDRFKGNKAASKYEFRGIKKDGSTIYVEISVSEILTRGDKVIGTRSFLRDVTDKKLNEINLKKRIKELQFLRKVADLSNMENLSTDRFLKEIIKLLPKAFSMPQQTSAEINFQNKKYYSENYHQTEVSRDLPLKLRGNKVGFLKVCLAAKGAPKFLDEEIDLLDTLAKQISEFIEKKYFQKVNKIQNKIANAVGITGNLGDLIKTIKKELNNIIDTTNFYIALYNKENDWIHIPYYSDSYDDIVSFKAQNTLTGYVIKEGKSILLNSKNREHIYKRGAVKIIGSESKVWLGVPLKIKNETIGVFVLQNYDDENAYNKKDLELIKFISNQIAHSLERQKSIEQLEKAKSRAEEVSKLKTTFLNNMSHEVRTPLNGIIGFSKLLNKKELSNEKKEKYVSIIEQNSNALIKIVDDLILISEIQTKQVQLIHEKVNVGEILMNVYNSFKSAFLDKNIHFSLDIEERIKRLITNTDKYRLTDIINRLVDNALKFTHAGTVKLHCALEDKKILISVYDTGIGIPKLLHEKIFLPFRQVEIGHNRNYGGNGLGLSIAKGFIEILGGKIWLTSSLGSGTTFYFNIPVSEEH